MDFIELKKLVKDLPEREVRSYLYPVLLQLSFLEEKEYPRENILEDLSELYNHIINPEEPLSEKPMGQYKMVHIIFGTLGGSLKQVFKEVGIDKEEHIISLFDNLAIGPITNFHLEKGQKARYEWFKKNIPDMEELKEYFDKAITQINSIPKEVPITFWVADNANEQIGLLFIIFLLKGKENTIFITNVQNLYKKLFIAKAKKYSIRSSGELPLKELKAIYQYMKENNLPLTFKQRESYEQLWESIHKDQTILRLWVDNEIIGVSEEYYDGFIVSKAAKLIGKKKRFIMAARLIGEVIGHLEQYVGDGFIEYRLKKLIDNGAFDYEGDLDEMIFYSVSLRNQKNTGNVSLEK